VFIVGDAWPVSLEKDAKEEGTQIMRQLREKYPKMVIIYFATNAQYNPEQLGYDYYIKLNSDYFSFESFKVQFQQVILKVIQDHVFNKSN
jgi:hypothetical protein